MKGRKPARSRLGRACLTLVCGSFWAVVAPGQEHTVQAQAVNVEVLTLQQVLTSVQQSHPGLEYARRAEQAAVGKRYAAEGVWDPTVHFSGEWVPQGHYHEDYLDAHIEQATPLWGAKVTAGYRLGVGEYPVYHGELETLSEGEVRAGVDLPLWKDGPIDAKRAKLRRTGALAKAAGCSAAAVQLKVRLEASSAYWNWVAKGQQVRIQRELLEVAKQRHVAVERQVSMGDLSPLVRVYNQRQVLERETKLLSVLRKFQKSTFDLSLYLRNAAGKPMTVDIGQVPDGIPLVDVDLRPEPQDIQRAQIQRPELCDVSGRQAAAVVDVEYTSNQRAPSVHVHGIVSQDLGEGEESHRELEVEIGVEFSMPLTLRKARGEYRAATAKAAKWQAKRRGLEDKVAVDVRKARAELRLAKREAELAAEQAVAADTLAKAERAKFAQGASDLVVVNLQEIYAADARLAELEARAALQVAQAAYRTATGDGI